MRSLPDRGNSPTAPANCRLPEFAAEFADLCDQLLESLQDQQLRDIA